jgi:riboflavin kinase/FMN adenylyltransferase
MKVIRWDLLESPETREFFEHLLHAKKGSALTIGGFDGPHRGHEGLFSSVLEAASRMGLASGIVTFIRSPGADKRPEQYPGDVSTLNLRLSRFAEKGFDFVLLIDFSGNFGKMTGGTFFDILVKTVHMRYVAVGPDFRCGHRLDTGVAEIAAISYREGFCFDSIQQIELDGLRISSSAVRNAVLSADFALAERFLGHPFLLDFTDAEWKQSGLTLEAPRSSFTQILPRRGSYDVMLRTGQGKSFPAMMEVDNTFLHVTHGNPDSYPSMHEITSIQFRLS